MGGKWLFILSFLSLGALAQQNTIIQFTSFNGEPISEARVDFPELGIVRFSDEQGRVGIRTPQAHFRVFVMAEFYTPLDTVLPINKYSHTLQLKVNKRALSEVQVTAQRNGDNYYQLRKIEGVSIFAGKKTEVIRPNDQPVNTALNNAREVFAKVTGMNVWEGDESGVQLNIGGRGLNPNRASNFNVRQNGYDISPDALGYPESYYTPPAEAVEQIEIVKGAASLQYGTQFGGLINFKMKGAPQRNGLEVLNRTTGGSYGLFNQFTSLGWRKNRLGTYAFGNYRRGDGWRPNSGFHSFNFFGQVAYDITDQDVIRIEYTYLDYLAQQPGGLDDAMFQADPRQSNRARNWFGLNWNILALHYDHEYKKAHLNIRLYGLNADRKALGFRNFRPAATDPGTERELITGDFQNAGMEARFLQRYTTRFGEWATLIGARAYAARNTSQQGLGTNGSDANFNFIDSPENLKSNYTYPNDNVSIFLEQLINLGSKWSITPGVRFEYINTRSKGYYREILRDLAGNIIFNETYAGGLSRERSFLLVGIGGEYQLRPQTQIYFNATQNFRAITYSDIHIVNPSFVIDQGIDDERGYSFDIGIRQHASGRWKFDISAFLLNYNNRIGEIAQKDTTTFRIVSYRTNIGQALIYGLENYLSYTMLYQEEGNKKASIFTNVSLVQSTYLQSARPEIVGNQVEFAPHFNLKAGLEGKYFAWKGRIQFTYLSRQFTDAANDELGGSAAVTGVIPSFNVLDLGLSYSKGRWQFETGVNNLFNTAYFTRRATGYPGPGIISSPGRSIYLGVQIRW